MCRTYFTHEDTWGYKVPWQFCVIIKSLWSNMLRIRGKRCCRRSCWYPRKDTYLLDQVRFAYCIYRKSCVCVCVLVAQLCPTLCDPMGCSPPGSPVHGILQARILEWVSISFSRGSSWPRDQTQVSRIAGRLFTIWDTSEAHRKVCLGSK